MMRFFYILFQFIVLLFLVSWAIKNSQTVSFTLNEIVVTTSTSILIIALLIIVFVALFLQRLVFFIRQKILNYKIKKEKSTYQKGYDSFLQGMVALANKDFKKAIDETRKVNKYFKDESLSLLLKSETLKIEKKFSELSDVYEKMLKNSNMNVLGLRGLMEQNLRSQDFHHALIYGEKLFNLNPRIDKLYDTLENIVGKTNNWHKLIQINDQALKKRIIDKKKYLQNKSIALYEIAKIKQHSSEYEAISLVEQALKLRDFFTPYAILYVNLLIEDNKLNKAKKVLNKAWNTFPHPDLKKEIISLSQAMKVSFYDIAKFVTFQSSEKQESKILLTESLIESSQWKEARNQLSPLLEHKPSKEICLLMAAIEEGDSNDVQKINSWISRSNFGKLGKVWICSISGESQSIWTSVSQAGYFNSLIWDYPNQNSKLYSSGFQMNKIGYIDN